MTKTVLRIDASARYTDSVSRSLADNLVAKLDAEKVIVRDLAKDVPPLITETMIGAYFTAPEDRSPEAAEAIKASDAAVAELQEADTIVIATPIYNFSVPGALKAWIDLIGRAGVTFKYTENGPVGLLEGKKAVILAASGGTPVGSEIDFAVPYLKHVLGFVGITEVEVIAADRVMARAEEAVAEANAKIDAYVA